MGGFIIVAGIVWVLWQLAKDATIKPVAPNQDIRQAYIDLNTGKISAKECDRRLVNGYYTKKEENE